MNQGVEIMLKRMESHPEEFQDTHDRYGESENKWTGIIRELYQRMEIIDKDNGNKPHSDGIRPVRYVKPLVYLTDEEVTVLYNKLVEVQGNMFTKQVMGRLLAPLPYEFNEDALSTMATTIRASKHP